MRPPSATSTTDRDLALAQYRCRADGYDLELAAFEPIREKAVAALLLHPGATVLDMGCGTGLSFAGLRNAIGARGRVVGVEQSPDMLGKAQARVAQQGWSNVSLVCSSAHLAELPAKADAALFHFTHDILRQPETLAHVLQHLKPGARVVASGLKWAGPWTWPLNWLVWPAALYSVSSLEGLRAPWDHLASQLDAVDLQTLWMDTVFIASGLVRR